MDTTTPEAVTRLANTLDAMTAHLRHYGNADALDTVLDELNTLRMNGYYERALDKLRESEGGE